MKQNLPAGNSPAGTSAAASQRDPGAATATTLASVTELRGPAVVLTPVNYGDAERVYDAVQDAEFARWLPWAQETYTWEDAQAFSGPDSEKSWLSGQPVWAIREVNDRGTAGQLCGVIDLRGTGENREIGFWMHRDSQGRGLTTSAAALVLECAFDVLGATRVVHLAAVGNDRSRRIARNLGFVPEGVRRVELPGGAVERQWQSALLKTDYQRLRRSADALTPGGIPGAEVLPGAAPADLVAEFHAVYGMPNRVAEGAESTVDFDRVDMRMSLIEEEVTELVEAVYGQAAAQRLGKVLAELPDDHSRDVVGAADALADLVYVIYGMALESGIDLDAVLAEVHSSNLSKLMPDGSVRRREDGKILKGPNFREPDIPRRLKGLTP